MTNDFYAAYFPPEISAEAAAISESCKDAEGRTDNDLLNKRLKVLWEAHADELGVPGGQPCLVTQEFMDYLRGNGWRWPDEWVERVKQSGHVIPEYGGGGIAFRMADGTWIGAIGGEASNLEMARRMRKAWLEQNE